MIIEKHVTEDKLRLFAFAGIAKTPNASGWDYAIPQHWFDQLLKMGVECPGAWYAADCSGPAAFPVLHHIGEAYAKLISCRQEDNASAHLLLCERTYNSDCYKGEKEFYKFIVNDNQAMAEVDSGFVDYNLLLRAFKAGMEAGVKHNKSKAQLKVQEQELHELFGPENDENHDEA